jgi:hydroxypyruvate reductase
MTLPSDFSHTLRQDALQIFQAGIEAANPYLAVKRAINFSDNHLELSLDLEDSSQIRIGRWSKVHLIAFGKAACAMAKAVQEVIPVELLDNQGVVVTNYENKIALENLTVIGAGHPLPDQSGLQAAHLITEQVKNAQQGGLVLVLISGGGSALLPAPLAPISLSEKIATTNLLLACGATIQEINCVRKHLSELKGGQLVRLAYPADVHALILSDVLGDDLSAIASGATVPDDTSYADAMAILKAYQIWEKVPDTVQQVLEQGRVGRIKETPKTGEVIFKRSSHALIGSNAMSVKAIICAAQAQGYQAQLYSQALCGVAREEAEKLALHVKKLLDSGLKEPTALLAGGETTVLLKGTGQGGRNQEMALAFALAAKKYQLPACWVFLSGGTDGRDGPTDAAGGMVDAGSLERIRNARLNPTNRLNNNDSYTALKSSSDLVMTGATGTNVADLQVLLIHPLLKK